MFNKLYKLGKVLIYQLSSHSQEILTGMAISGTITMSITSAKAAIKAKDELEKSEIDISQIANAKAAAKVVLPIFTPTILIGAGTIMCMLCAHNVGSRRQAALASMYAISESTMREFQDKILENEGKKKVEKLRGEILTDHVNNNPPKEGLIINSGKGNSLCFDNWTGRYFLSDVDTLRRVEIDLNQEILNGFYISINELYDRLNIPLISEGENIGWNYNSEGTIDLGLYWTSSPADDNRPCLIMDPKPGFRYIQS